MKHLFFITALVALFAASCSEVAEKVPVEKKTERRIVSLNGTITEILYALGAENEIVAVDVTSTFPEEVQKLTNLGHVRAVTAESILSVAPTCILAFEDELNPRLRSQLEKSGVEIVAFKREFTLKGTEAVMSDVGRWLGEEQKTAKLTQKLKKEFNGITLPEKAPRVLFVYARGTGTMMVAGDNTQMAKMITMAGGVNATGGFDDFKPLTAEAVVAADPDAILMFDSGAASLNDAGGILAIPGVKTTNAGKNKAFIAMDGQLLSGFGPRLGEAVKQLNKELSKVHVGR